MLKQNDGIRIKRHLSVVAHSPDIVEVRSGVWNSTSFVLNDSAETGNLFRLLERLDGSLSPAALARELQIPREQVETVVDHLDQAGLLETRPSNVIDHYLGSVVSSTVGATAPDAERTRSVVLLGGSAVTDRIARLLDEMADDIEICAPDRAALEVLEDPDTSWLFDGIAFQERMQAFEPWRDRLVVLATTAINPIQAKILNRASIEYGFSWLHSATDGPFVLVGPVFVPGRTACYECFEQRVMMNMRDSATYVSYKNALAQRRIRLGEMPVEPILQELLACHSALEIVNYATTRYAFVRGKALSIFLPTMEFTYNEVLRLPGCPSCSPLAERDDTELHFDMTALIER